MSQRINRCGHLEMRQQAWPRLLAWPIPMCKWGSLAADWGPLTWPLQITVPQAKEYALTGARISAGRAVEIAPPGIVIGAQAQGAGNSAAVW